jgi:UDPglucose 6-dehydrogenase
MRIGVVGVGHVGLVTSAAAATLGHEVVGMDADPATIRTLQDGEIPFHEDGLGRIVADGLRSGALRFTTSIDEAVRGAAIVFVCVGRPPVGSDDRSMPAVEEAVRAIAGVASDGLVLVIKSTVPPGTAARVADLLGSARPGLDVAVASSPEFLRQGQAIEDALRPDRIVVGTEDPRAIAALRAFHRSTLEVGVPMIETDPRSAELAKLASNAFLATKVSFANAVAKVSDLVGADAIEVTRIMGVDHRIGSAFLGPGIGFGGSCLPKDLATLERLADREGFDFGVLRETARLNDAAVSWVARLVEDAVWSLDGATVTLLGLSYKPGTDDVHGSPALALARRLLDGGADVAAFDPRAGVHAASADARMRVERDPYDAATGSSCLVLATAWPELLDLDLPRLKSLMTQPAVVDAANACDAAAFRAAGFSYAAVGRRTGDP